MINNYNDFITESLVFKLVLEGKMVYSDSFIDILTTMPGEGKVKTMISDIIKSMNIDVDIKPNYIDVSDKSDTIKFIPDDKVGLDEICYKRNGGSVLRSHHSLVDDLVKTGQIPTSNNLEDEDRSSTSRFRFIKEVIIKGYEHLRFYYLKVLPNDPSDDDDRFIILYNDCDLAMPISPLIPKSNRTSEIKIGRFIKRFFDTYQDKSRFYTAGDIEKFVDEYISTVLYLDNALDNFSVVDGDDIRHWYNVNSYEFNDDKGQLGQSCMRHEHCENYFEIYVNNPEKCKLLIFKSSAGNLLGRALLWVLDDGTKYMDRIYTSQNSFNILFKNWGSVNGYNQYYPLIKEATITLKEEVYDEYPYMDTFHCIKFETDPELIRPLKLDFGRVKGLNKYSSDDSEIEVKLLSVVLYNEMPLKPFYELASTEGRLASRI